jgi:hypothetical protein
MSTYAEIWKTLSTIDVSDKVEKKQGLAYLSWAWAWGVLMEEFPQAFYEFPANTIEADGSVSVNVVVDIGGNKRAMWLPVMNHKNQAIQNPDAVAVNKARMRCLVKCLAMFGLGHYIYAGEDLPDAANEANEMLDKCMAAIAIAADGATLKSHFDAGVSLVSTVKEKTALIAAKDKRKQELGL